MIRVGATLGGAVWLLNSVSGVFGWEDYTPYVNLLVGTQGAIPGVSWPYIFFETIHHVYDMLVLQSSLGGGS